MITTFVPFLIAITGTLVYAFSSNAKVAELGRIAYFVGLFWTVYLVAGHVIRF